MFTAVPSPLPSHPLVTSLVPGWGWVWGPGDGAWCWAPKSRGSASWPGLSGLLVWRCKLFSCPSGAHLEGSSPSVWLLRFIPSFRAHLKGIFLVPSTTNKKRNLQWSLAIPALSTQWQNLKILSVPRLRGGGNGEQRSRAFLWGKASLSLTSTVPHSVYNSNCQARPLACVFLIWLMNMARLTGLCARPVMKIFLLTLCKYLNVL